MFISDKSNNFGTQHVKILQAQKSIYEETGELLDYAVTMIKLSSQVNIERSERFDDDNFFQFHLKFICL